MAQSDILFTLLTTIFNLLVYNEKHEQIAEHSGTSVGFIGLSLRVSVAPLNILIRIEISGTLLKRIARSAQELLESSQLVLAVGKTIGRRHKETSAMTRHACPKYCSPNLWALYAMVRVVVLAKSF